MTRRCILHLGMHKTGSTSIQYALQGYDDGKTTYLPLANPNHSLAMQYMFSRNPPTERTLSRQPNWPPGTAEMHRAALQDVLAQSDRNIIISGEGLTNFPDLVSIAAVTDFLSKYFREIRAIAYVREPVGFVRSAFQQRLRSGPAGFMFDKMYPRYQRRLSGWRRLLGPANIQAVEFSTERFKDGDLLVDFCSRAGLTDLGQIRTGVMRNPSLSAESTALLYAYRHARGVPAADSGMARQNSAVIGCLQRFGDRKYTFSDAVLGRLLEETRADVAWVERWMIGSLKPGPRRGDEVVFDTEEDVLAYAETLAQHFRDWARPFVTKGLPVASGLLETMDAMYQNGGLARAGAL